LTTDSTSQNLLDTILALQMTVAWAGEGLCDPKRLNWWRTDLVDELGGGDLFQRLSYFEKLGYKIQSSAGQEWQRERDARSIIPDEISMSVGEKLKTLLGNVERPRYKTRSFPWAALYSDGNQRQDERLQMPNDLAVVTVDFRYTNTEDRNPVTWVQASDSQNLRDRLIWVVGRAGAVSAQVKELARSRYMINKYAVRRESISRDKQRLLLEEQSRCDKLEKDVHRSDRPDVYRG